LAESCNYEVGHAHQVTRLALQLFDELRIVHGLGSKERHWLLYAALLHDIGWIKGQKKHHKTSLRIIRESPLLPFDESERLIIGSVARYHRRALPSERHAHFAKLKPAGRRVVSILAAILRVADGLDYTHKSLVKDLCCAVSPQQIAVRCAVRQPADVDCQRALGKGELMVQAFGRKLAIEWHLD